VKCGDVTFERKWLLERHILERHSDFCWRCPDCKKLVNRQNSPHSTCKVSAEDMICFQNSTGIKGKEAEEALGRYRRVGINKDMKILTADGKEIELDQNGRRKRDLYVVRESAEKSTAAKHRRIEVVDRREDRRERKIESEKSVNPIYTSRSHSDVVEPATPLVEKTRRRSSKCSTCSESSSTSSSSVSCASGSQSSAKNVCVSQGVREESVDRIIISETVGSSDHTVIVDTFLQSLQDIQESQVILNIGGMKFETSKVTLRADPTSVFALMQNPNSQFRPCNNIYFFDRDPAHFRIILGYLRNNCYMEKRMLPNEARYLHEILSEARFYRLLNLVTIVEDRIRDLCLCKLIS